MTDADADADVDVDAAALPPEPDTAVVEQWRMRLVGAKTLGPPTLEGRAAALGALRDGCSPTCSGRPGTWSKTVHSLPAAELGQSSTTDDFAQDGHPSAILCAAPPGRWRPNCPQRPEVGAKVMTTEGKPRTAGRFRISKSFEFSASHELWLLPETHKCRRNHGHNYVVTLTLTADRLDKYGFVTDFGVLLPFGDYLKSTFDHRRLNDQVDFHPTSELLAQHFGCWFIDNVEVHLHGRLVSVQVSETDSSSGRWERGDAL